MSGSVRDLLSLATARLDAAGVASPRYDAEALLAWAVGTPGRELHRLDHVDDAAAARFVEAVTRRVDREPLQHVTGSAAFRYLELEVGRGVFVPRPETEVMTGVAVEELRRLMAGGLPEPVAVDLCTGSGAVALALATEAPGSRVTAVEVSVEAHAFAVRNVAGHGIDLRLGDIADAVDDLEGRVHVVTANPPYIPLEAFESVDVEARDFDPPVALWSGEDGLDAIHVVAEVASRLLVPGGLVLCEHADVQGESAPQVFAATGHWREVGSHRDLAGRPRFVTARRVPTTTRGTGTMSP